MGASSWIPRAAAALAVAAALATGRASRADLLEQFRPYLLESEGPLVRARISIGFQGGAPPLPRATLVESGVPDDQAQRVRLRLRRVVGPDGVAVAGVATSALVADRVYDVVLEAGDQPPAVLPAAFTARAPRLTLDAASAARGESVGATVEFGSGAPRFRIGSAPARVASRFGEGDYAVEVPRRLPRGTVDAKVTVMTAGRRVEASRPLTIVPKRGVVAADVDGVRRTFARQSYFTATHVLGSYRAGPPAPQVYVTGSTRRRFGVGTADEELLLRVPLDLATATFPVTLTAADGVVVTWSNGAASGADGVDRNWLPGPRGFFRGTSDVAVTFDSFDGARLRGTFSAHLVNAGTSPLDDAPDGREFDVTDGRFEVDPQ